MTFNFECLDSADHTARYFKMSIDWLIQRSVIAQHAIIYYKTTVCVAIHATQYAKTGVLVYEHMFCDPIQYDFLAVRTVWLLKVNNQTRK